MGRCRTQTKTLAPWVGGKHFVAGTIIKYIPNTMFNRWFEPFGGAGGMLMAKPRWAIIEVWNDIHGDMYNLWKVIQTKHEEFIEARKYEIKSREMFQYWKDLNPTTDAEQAQRFWYLCYYSFGATCTTWGALQKHPYDDSVIERVYKRIKRVNFENLDYEVFIEKYKGFKTERDPSNKNREPFWYIDPPYAGVGKTQEYSFKNFNQEKLKETLSSLNDKWLQTNTDCEQIRELYKDFYIKPFARSQRIKNGSDKERKNVYAELMIANYDLDKVYQDNISAGQGRLKFDN